MSLYTGVCTFYRRGFKTTFLFLFLFYFILFHFKASISFVPQILTRLLMIRTEFLESRKWNTSAAAIELLLRKQVILLLLIAHFIQLKHSLTEDNRRGC